MKFDLQLFNDPGAAPVAPAAPVVPTAPTGVQVTPTGAPGGMQVTVPTADNSQMAAQAAPAMSSVEGAVVVPIGTPGSIVFQGQDGQQVAIMPSAQVAAGSPQAPQAPQQVPPTQTPADPTKGAQGEPQTVQQANANAQAIQQDLTAKGVDFNALSSEFESNGELSEQSLAALEKAGYPKAMVDAYVAGMQAAADRFVNDVYKMAGGEEAWNNIAAYAKNDPALVSTLNAAVNAGDLGQLQLMVEGVQARMTTAYGTANPSVLGNGAGVNQATQGYSSTSELVKAMQDPRYQTDAKYTQEVYARVNASNL